MSNLRDAIVRMALRRPYLYLLVTLVISIVLMEVLVEKRDGLSGAYRGRGYNSAPDGVDGSITFQAKEELEPGCFVKVRITEAGVHDLYGEQC